MVKVNPVSEAAFVDMDDPTLLELLGFLHEELKNLDERMGADERLLELQAAVKEYKDTNYLDLKKSYRVKLRASRALAKARGLKFQEPK